MSQTRTLVTRLRNDPIEGEELEDGGRWEVTDFDGNSITVDPDDVPALVAVAEAIQLELEMRGEA